MSETHMLQQKIIGAIKGLLNTYRLVPMFTERQSKPSEYKNTGRTFFDKEGTGVELYVKTKSHSSVIELTERLYIGQTDGKFIDDLMKDILSDWIVGDKNPNDQKLLEEVGEEFLKQVVANIKPRQVFLPIEGLKVNTDESFQIGNCELHNNHKSSSFMEMLKQGRKLRSKDIDAEENPNNNWTKAVKSYFTYEISAHSGRAIDRGIEAASLALNILRLYMSSNYFNEYRVDMSIGGTVKRMGLYGSLHLDERSRIFYVNSSDPLENQYPGGRDSRIIHRDFEITDESVEYMNAHGLKQINTHVQSLTLGPKKERSDDIARRLFRAITWFGKATTAKTVADCYLMYAIAIEGLLSEDRTPQETYSTQMAALITCNKDDCSIYPIGGYLSSGFGKQLKRAKTLNDKFNLIRERITKLFSYRNRIAHGAILENEIEGDNLLDFETIVQNSILSFVMNDWDTFESFKQWVNKSVRLDFTPVDK